VEVVESLYEAERPIVFITNSVHRQTLLGYVADETEEGTWYLLAPISQARLLELRVGALTVRDALIGSWLWQCLETHDGLHVWPVEPASIPEIFLPARGTPLLPEHEAAIVTRAVGDGVRLGCIPASVIAFVTDATRSAVKTLLDFVSETPSEGRPTVEHRALYDLPVQRFAFSSFEVAFGAPDTGLFSSSKLVAATERLEMGLIWAASSKDEPLSATTDEERAAVLRAVLLLTPPSGGPISEIHVSGSWMKRGQIRIGRETRKKVRAELRALDSERVATYSGRIGEVDRDRCTFILRDTEDKRDHKGVFADELLDDVLQYFTDSRTVTVAGVERGGQLHVAALAPTDAVPPG
jgi:hypothetical protein